MSTTVDRAQVLAYRIARQGLPTQNQHRSSTPVDDLDIVDLGVQDTPPGSSRLALGVRTDADVDAHNLVRAWTLRASPFLHHAEDLPKFAAALWPHSERDALGKVAWQRSVMQKSGITATQAIRYTAEAMQECITSPTVKGVASTAVSKVVPKALVSYCRGCQAEHVFESLFRLAALPGGLRLDLDQSPPLLVPIENWPGIPEEQHGTDDLITLFLTFVGPASYGDVAAWLTTTQTEIKEVWPAQGLVEVDIDGRKAWIPESEMDLLLDPPEPPRALLVPTSDPFLQDRNKLFLVPDKAHHKTLWPVIGQPGAVLVDGDIVGIWRTKATRKKLEVKITEFMPIPPDAQGDVEAEAGRIAALRGIQESVVSGYAS
ncbi:winged helix DNA-binding domain-containing protein [Kibdelosporangium philippinense]|uniref:Winged helix DNA-binding domain-containing protein n=1 Tax=Kibdelosporangium philippinense TaxID=211113 RepID=A0ABS8ZH64_9PSEU|nr:winged helix DNA-binding domain-containing protein [Kibdelosporangium philippinense]MCE7007163.1 winged helix DNA-binding domain-containing protein [Kibdelosporangium philippinense]